MQNSPQDLRKKVLGRKGEELAASYLKREGYKILKRNYKTPFGEADIVALSKDGYTCFVEVKARESDAYGHPAEAVTREKQRRYRQIAKFYCATLREEVSVRFDVASVLSGELDYIENAFI